MPSSPYDNFQAEAVAVGVTPRAVIPSHLLVNYDHRTAELRHQQYKIPAEDGQADFLKASWEEFQAQYQVGAVEGHSQGLIYDTTQQYDLWRGSFPLEWPLQQVAQNQMAESLKRILPHLGPRSVLMVDLNWQEVAVYGFRRFFRSHQPQWNYTGYHFDLSSAEDILNYFTTPENFPLLSKKMAAGQYHNTVMNLLSRFPLVVRDEQAMDIIRAVYTNVLLRVFEDFPVDSFRFYDPHKGDEAADFPLVMVTGEVPAAVQEEGLVWLMLLDGLQLSGVFYCSIDRENKMKNLLQMNSDSFTLPLYTLFDDQIDLMVARSTKFPVAGKLAWEVSGQLAETGSTTAQTQYIAPRGEVRRFSLEHAQVVKLAEKKIPDIAVSDLRERIPVHRWRSLIFDLRDTPVKYGPSTEHNTVRVAEWLHGFNTILAEKDRAV